MTKYVELNVTPSKFFIPVLGFHFVVAIQPYSGEGIPQNDVIIWLRYKAIQVYCSLRYQVELPIKVELKNVLLCI